MIYTTFAFNNLTSYMNDLLAIIILILLNGIFAMSEMALISAKKVKLQKQSDKGNRSARIALKLAEQPDKFLSTIQIGITLIGILTGIFSSDMLAKDFGDFLISKGLKDSYAYQLAQGIIVVCVTYLSIVLGELVPKRIGLNMADRAARTVSIPMYILSIIATPFVWILSKSTGLLVRLFGLQAEENQVTEEEIKTLIEEGTASGVVQEVEQDIVERTFMLGDMDIKSIMTRRKDTVNLKADMPYAEVARIISETPFEVYPVENPENGQIIGSMSLKNFAELSLDQTKFPRDVMNTPVFFPENMSVYRALGSMKERKLNRAFVCDEFGIFVGIITLRDILEALVGTVSDDANHNDIIQHSENEWYVDGQCPFHDFLLHFDIEDIDATQYNTMSGLVLDQMERIPKEGEFIHWQGWRIEIADMDGVRIDKLLVRKENEPEA